MRWLGVRQALTGFGGEIGDWRMRAVLMTAARHFDAGELRVQVGATFPPDQAADAHRALEAGQIIGKAVLTIE